MITPRKETIKEQKERKNIKKQTKNGFENDKKIINIINRLEPKVIG